MQYVNLGRSGLKVSRLCLGTMNFGYVTDEAEAFKIMDESVAQGVNFLTAPTFMADRKSPILKRVSAFPKKLSAAGWKKAKNATAWLSLPNAISR